MISWLKYLFLFSLAAFFFSHLSGCCEDGRGRITQQPRFAPQDVAVPDRRGHYPATFDAAVTQRVNFCRDNGNVAYAGMDFEFTYAPVEPMKSSYRIFQFVTGATAFYHTVQNECGDLEKLEEPKIIEYWKPDRAQADVILINYCTERKISSSLKGMVAIIDLDDLDDETIRQINAEAARQELISPDENIVNLTPTVLQGPNGPFTHEPLTPAKFQKLRKKIEDCIAIEWDMRYEYDGCSSDPVDPNDPPNTFCQQIHCMRFSWEDDDGRHAPPVFMSK